jgi:2-polyprenyl-3-methyl-5-hydroxy-6-metoxy-1,4-benzoquinol methylase
LFEVRLIEPELLDHAGPDEARQNLTDLVRINRYFGGYSTAARVMQEVARPEDAFTMLDVGAASGDIGRHLQSIYPRAQIVSLDSKAVNMELASQPKLLADAFEPPFEAGSFDYVFSSLFLHHFTDEQVVKLLRGFGELARRAVLVVDLERHVIPWCFLPTTRPFLGWKRITVHDGCISVRAAFTPEELAQMAKQAGLTEIRIARYRPAFRVALIGRRCSGRCLD